MCDDEISVLTILVFFFFQAEDGIRDLVRSRGLGDVYKRQEHIIDHVKQMPAGVLDLRNPGALPGGER